MTSPISPSRRSKAEILSWCLFDFANSSYSAVISAVVFPVYYATVIVGNAAGEGDLWWGRSVAASIAFVAITSPFAGGIADFSGRRKTLLALYTGFCILSVACFSFLGKGMVVAGFLLAALANAGMEGGIVFYNSYLPEIAGPSIRGRVSAWGFGVGYAGSVASLLVALPLLQSGNFPAVWLMVAGFFFLFSLPAFLVLPAERRQDAGFADAAGKGVRYFMDTVRSMKKNRSLVRFLAAYLVYEDGVNTVIVFSSLFAATTLHFGPQELIWLYLLVQVTALAGAFAMARPIDTMGPRSVVMLSLVLWCASAVAAFFITEKSHFWILASVAGLGLGTVQAASRALFSRFIPVGHESEYFGVYAMVGKSSAIAGPLVFGGVSSAFGSQRPAILSVALFFIVGLLLLKGVGADGPDGRTVADAG